MALYYHAGVDAEATPMAVAVAGPGSGTATVASARFCWTSLSAIGQLNSEYTSLATAIQTALNSVVAGFTVSYSTSTHLVTISHASTFSLTFSGTSGTNLRNTLGFTGNKSGSTSYVGDVRPYYVMVPDISARSMFSDVYEPDDIVVEAVADDGEAFGVDKDTSELWCDWMQSHEPKAATLQRSAASSAPWTWEHFFKHLRMLHPFYVLDGSSSTAHRLRASGAGFNSNVRRRVTEDLDAYWNIYFQTRDLGTV